MAIFLILGQSPGGSPSSFAIDREKIINPQSCCQPAIQLLPNNSSGKTKGLLVLNGEEVLSSSAIFLY